VCTASPSHRLIKNDACWEWEAEHDVIFKELKDLLTSSATLVHYDEDKPLVITTDASDVGVGAVLMHRFPDGSERPIAYASRVLSEVERRYASIDKEALAIIFAVGKFQQYILGRHFTVKTDHRPLERLFGSKTELPKLAASRLNRWATTLSMYDYDIQYHSGGSNAPADVLSRFPVDPPEEHRSTSERIGEHSNLLHLKLQDFISKRQLQQKTVTDPIMVHVIAYLERGWPVNTAPLQKELHTYFEQRQEISFEENILLWRGRIVVPSDLQTSVVQILHEGHPGVCAMKELAKFYAWLPHIDDDIEHLVAFGLTSDRLSYS